VATARHRHGSCGSLTAKRTNPLTPTTPGAFTAGRTAKDQGVPISTISFGTPYGTIDYDNARIDVPVADDTLKKSPNCPAAPSTTPPTSTNSRTSAPPCKGNSVTTPSAETPVRAGSVRRSPSPTRQQRRTAAAELDACNARVGTAVAARMLGWTTRRVQRNAEMFGGEMVAERLVFRERDVLACASRMNLRNKGIDDDGS
jgi:hypothetical protein